MAPLSIVARLKNDAQESYQSYRTKGCRVFFVTQAEIDQIRGKMRRRVLHLPVEHELIKGTARHPRTGRTLPACDVVGGKAIKRCPLRERSVTTLAPGVTHAQYRAQAQAQSTRAMGVLWFLDRCETLRTVTITVTKVERQGDVWLVHFAKGDRADELDHDVFLAKYGDYTMSASKQAVPGDPPVMMPLAEDLAKARAKARERRVSPQRELVSKMQADADTLQRALSDMKDRTRAKLIAKELEKLAAKLSVDESAIVLESVCVARQAPVDAGDEPRPCDIYSDVPLGSPV